MSKNVSDLVKEVYRVEGGMVFAEKSGVPESLDATDCVERLDAYQSFIVDSPALHTLSREVEVPDRHTIRTIIEEMEACVSTGVSPVQLGFWVAELSRVSSDH